MRKTRINRHDYPVYETERLFIKPVFEGDAAFIKQLLNTPKFIDYIGDRKVRTVKDAKNYIQEKMLPQLKQLGFGNYVVIRKPDHAKMGTCGLFNREGLDVIDIGFAFLPEYEGQGYAYESAHKMLQLAREEFKIKEVCAITTKVNASSQKLIERIGLTYKGTTRIPNDDEELMYYYVKF